MNNMFRVLKVSLLRAFIGVSILLISMQTFAICDEEMTNNNNAKITAYERQGLGRRPSPNELSSQTKIEDSIKGIAESTDLERALQIANESIKRRYDIAKAHNDASIYTDPDFTSVVLYACEVKEAMKMRSSRSASSTSNRPQQSQQQSAQSQSQSSSQPQQQSQQNQQRAQEAQQRVEQDRKGKRRRHEPESEAHQCIDINNNDPGFGSFVNKCNFAVEYNFCNFNSKKDSWAEAHNCVGRSGNAGAIKANGVDGAHVKNTQTVYFFACKSPAWPVDTEYVAGQGIRGRCHTMGRD